MRYLILLLLALSHEICCAADYEKIGESTAGQTKSAVSFLFGETELKTICQKQAPVDVLASDWIVWLTETLCQKSASRLCTSALLWQEERPTTLLVTDLFTQAEIVTKIKAKELAVKQPVFIKKSPATTWDVIKCRSITLIQPHLELAPVPKAIVANLLKSRGLKTDAQGKWKLSGIWDKEVLQKNRNISASTRLVILGTLDEFMK